MCGINGIYAYRDTAGHVDERELVQTRDHMGARGPDGKGIWISRDRRVALGHRRLSIIDLSVTGAQPMTSVDGKLVVTFNGEIYNFRDLRQGLKARGSKFRSASDTEVLLHLYAEKGEAMVHELRGMFAFGIWNDESKKLFLARDPYGIKPLYYSDNGSTLRFASQVKALVAGGKISHEIEPAAQVGFYLWGSVPEPFTIYSQIRALPAGCTITVGRDGVGESKRYHNIAAVYQEAELEARAPAAERDIQVEIREALFDSVKHHLVSDVPVGAFLSAGIDSGSSRGIDARRGRWRSTNCHACL